MRYRIKIETYGDGEQRFLPQVRKGGRVFYSWEAIGDDGEEYLGIQVRFRRREYALKVIDEHYKGKCKVKSVEFEYITK